MTPTEELIEALAAMVDDLDARLDVLAEEGARR